MKAWRFVLIATLLCGCSASADFNKAKRLEKKGHYYAAWILYQKAARKNPKSPKAPEALFRAGLLAERNLGDCAAAAVFYDTVIDKYPQADPWARASGLQKDSCPDYYPLHPGSEWVEGDSDSFGKNARVEIFSSADSSRPGLPNETARVRKTFYAGTNKFQSIEIRYERKNSELLEFASLNDPTSKIILRWPLSKGAAWSTKYGGQLFRYTVVSLNERVAVKAGEFNNCVKIQSSIDGSSGVKNEYYAPSVGRVLTTLSLGDNEKRNTELLSFKISPLLLFEEEGKK